MPEPRACEARTRPGSRGVVAHRLATFAGKEGLGTETLHSRWRLDLRDQKLHRFSWTFIPSGIARQYAGVVIHAGLVCLNGPDGMDLDVQIEMFEQVLDELADDADLVNQVLEITLEDGEEFHILRYRLPAESG